MQFFTNVPAGYAMLADALEEDADLRRTFFSKLRLALYGGAGLPQALYDRLQRLAVEETGKRIFFTTGYGATETSSGCMAIYFHTEEVGIGLPMPGLTVKLVPSDDRYEVRFRGPMMTPGYVGGANDGLYDDEGYLKIGDYAQFIEAGNIQCGLKFAGRVAEEFKLATGTWVAGGALRARLVHALSPFVSDAVICAPDADYLGALLWLNRDAAERALGYALPQTPTDLANDPGLRGTISNALITHNREHPGSSTCIQRVAFLVDPPSIDGHELSDKGTVNQSVALRRRATEVETLYAANADDSVIRLD